MGESATSSDYEHTLDNHREDVIDYIRGGGGGGGN